MTLSLNSQTIILISVDWFIVFVGIIGNILVIISILKFNSIKNTVTKMLFINLAISDLGVLIIRHTFDSIQLYLKGQWIFGGFGCRVIPPASRTFQTVSIVTLVAISYHRYNGIVHVLRQKQSAKKIGVTICLIWLTTLAVNGVFDIPFRKLNESTGRCVDRLSRVKYIAYVIIEKGFYVLCFISIFYMFAKMKKALAESVRIQQTSYAERQISQSVKTMRLLKPTVAVLFITLFPAWLLHTYVGVKQNEISTGGRYLIYHIIGILMVINSSANPFIYVMASRSFKNSFRRMLCSVFDNLKREKLGPTCED